MFCHVDDTVKSLTLRISSCLRLACSLIELTRQTNANDFLSDSVEINSYVYTKTIIIFNRSENWPQEYLLRCEIFATIHLDLNE